MKVIFIDIDGVLNSTSGQGPYESEMEVEKLLLLKKLINETGTSGVVIISERRLSIVDIKHKLEVFKMFSINVLGSIRKPNHGLFDNRGRQIQDYLELHPEIDTVVILDDFDEGISKLFKDEYIRVNNYYGLNEDIYNKAVEILK